MSFYVLYSTCNHWKNISLYKYIMHSLAHVPTLLEYPGVLQILNKSPGLLCGPPHPPTTICRHCVRSNSPTEGRVPAGLYQTGDGCELHVVGCSSGIINWRYLTLPYHVPVHVVCQNKFQVKMNFRCFLTLFIHGPWLVGFGDRGIENQTKLKSFPPAIYTWQIPWNPATWPPRYYDHFF